MDVSGTCGLSPEDNAIEVEPHSESVEELLRPINLGSSFDVLSREEEKLRQKLRFYYMNPIDKWQYKQRLPYKFFIQVLKVIVVTFQAYFFAYYRTEYVNFVLSNKIAFSHLFLQGWDSSREIISYPPQSGDMAVYKISEFYSAIDYAVINYANLKNALGSYSYTQEDNSVLLMEFCVFHYKKYDIFAFNESYILNTNIVKTYVSLKIPKNQVTNFSSKQFFSENNITINFSALVKAYLSFGVKTVNLKSTGPKSPPGCFKFNLTIVFDNNEHDGKIRFSLDTVIYRLHCNGNFTYESDTHVEVFLQAYSFLNATVIIFCIISFILCSRAIYKAQCLKQKTVQFFRKHYNKSLSFRDQFEFINLWYVTMITSDCIVIIGSSLKEKIEKNEFSGDEWNFCSVILGTGTFLIWFCVLRYLGFFRNYNVIVLTLKIATPMILRYLVCTMIIYAGFVFCGWVVLGPYHTKFRTLSITSECLFALMNGDDVFGTFSTLEPTKPVLIWWFSRIYLFVFEFLFTYVVISLFSSIILDAYDTIKRYYKEGFPKSEIQKFIEGGFRVEDLNDSSSSLADNCPQYCNSSGLNKILKKMCCCTMATGQKIQSKRDS